MRVLLISANTEPINMPIIPVGLGAVAAATRDAGHEVHVVDLMNVGDTRPVVKDAIETLHPDVIGVSVRNIDDQNIRQPLFLLDQVKGVISDCRSLTDVPVVLGGAGYSVFPEAALAYLSADMGIQGEGEVAFSILLDRMEGGSDLSDVPGLYLAGSGLQGKRQFQKNLDLMPFADADLWTPPSSDDNDLYMPVQTRRGCPMNCSYCSTSCIEGSIIRKRSPEVVVDALARLVEKGFRRFFFTDNIFNIPPSYARELCSVIADRDLGIVGRCIIYPGKLDEALVKEMARAGCTEVALGFESGSERVLKSMNKKFTPEDVRRTCDMLADHGIFQMGFLLLGGPGETRASVEESVAFADSLPVNVMKIAPGIRIYPFTSLAKQALSEGMITPEDDLLFPKFYVAPELKDWLLEAASQYTAERPNWVT
jgi:radical SAM superfamily enzyme YgiQ (UPF0313 family)